MTGVQLGHFLAAITALICKGVKLNDLPSQLFLQWLGIILIYSESVALFSKHIAQGKNFPHQHSSNMFDYIKIL